MVYVTVQIGVAVHEDVVRSWSGPRASSEVEVRIPVNSAGAVDYNQVVEKALQEAVEGYEKVLSEKAEKE